ncbi:MAG: putative membrane protein [Parcubacteria bacterium C7867-003]|nr:MAG: putative membrane protein [Parcubacteria bacterium C7867-003]
MNKTTVTILKVGVVVMGIFVLVFMLWEPHLEGRNVNSTFFEVYFKDPFLAYAYIASVAFFVALYQTFKLLGNVGENKIFTPESLKSLRTIKYCGRVLLAFVLGFMGYLFIVRPEEDIAGGVFMCLIAVVVSGGIATVASRFEKVLQGIIGKN